MTQGLKSLYRKNYAVFQYAEKEYADANMQYAVFNKI
jgi:hypothetical protein